MQKTLKILLFSALFYNSACFSMEASNERQPDKIQELPEETGEEHIACMEEFLRVFGSRVRRCRIGSDLKISPKQNAEKADSADVLVSTPENSPKAAPES